MKALGELHRGALSRDPSDRALARAVGVVPTTVGKWLDGAQFPQRPDGLVALVHQLRTQAQRLGLLDGDVAVLLDAHRWADQHRAVLQERAAATGEQVRRVKAEEELVRQDQQARLAALQDRPRPVAAWTADQLGVHAAITGIHGSSDAFVLPTYVSRSHDEHLRALLTALADGALAGLVVVRGGSCTGKTRSAFEAVRASLPDWRLLFPKDTGSLLAALAADAVEPRTVLWLNEAQEYLYGQDGEACAAALRRRLEGAGPMVVIATLWPVFHHELTTTPQVGEHDPHPQARALLGQAITHDLPDHFTATELDALKQRAGDDASLAVAHEASSRSGMVTQVLAAGPALVAHYEQPAGPYGAYSRALITAAMDARRLGFSAILPLDLLVAAAPGYLTDQQRADPPDDWEAEALAYARIPVKGVVAALGLVPRATGMGAQPGIVRLADYLDQYGRTSRGMSAIPAAMWDSLSEHAPESELTTLGRSARDWGLLRLACSFYHRAACNGDVRALLDTAEILHDAGRDDDAISWYRRAAEVSLSTTRSTNEPEAAEEAGLEEKAIAWVQSLADFEGRRPMVRHISGPMRAAGRMLNETGRSQEALAWYQRLTESGSVHSPHEAVRMLRETGQEDQVIPWMQARAESGSFTASIALGTLLQEAGRIDDAVSWYESQPMENVIAPVILKEAGRIDEALACYQRRIDAGDLSAAEEAGRMLEEAGRLDEAVLWYRRANALDRKRPTPDPGRRLLDAARRATETVAWYQRFNTGTSGEAPNVVSELVEAADRLNDAIPWLERLVDADGEHTVDDTHRLATESERINQVIVWLQQLAEAGSERHGILDGLADLLAAVGRTEDAIVWMRRAAEHPGSYPVRETVRLLKQVGRAEEAWSWLKDRAEAGDSYALEELAQQLRAAGHIDDAITWYRRAVEAGDFYRYTLEAAIRLEKAAGRIDDAITWLWGTAERTGNGEVARQLAQLLAVAGRIDDAINWFQRAGRLGTYAALNEAAWSVESAGETQRGRQMRLYGWEPDGSIASPWTIPLPQWNGERSTRQSAP